MRQRFEVLERVLVTVLGHERFALVELDHLVAERHTLRPLAHQVHLDA